MSAIQQTIVLLEQELEGLDHRRCEITRVIDTLRPLAGEAVTRVSRSGGRRNGSATKATRAATRAGDEDHSAKVLAALRTSGGSITPGALATALKLDRSIARRWVRPLLQSKAIIATGATMNRRLSLPGHGPKEAP